ncbi:MAG: ATP-binding cassette domain-containing protein, partial [Candidatus Methanofastidiosia archaeon]
MDNVSFSVKQGEVVGIIGKSGAGKSVLIHTIRGSRDYAPDSGKIVYNFSYCENCDIYDFLDKVGSK